MKRAWALPLTEAQQYNALNMVMQLNYVTENSLCGTVPYVSRSWSPMGGGIEKHWSYFTLNWNNTLRGFNISNWIIPLNNNCFNTWIVCIPFLSLVLNQQTVTWLQGVGRHWSSSVHPQFKCWFLDFISTRIESYRTVLRSVGLLTSSVEVSQ